jgi:hypothetical protein
MLRRRILKWSTMLGDGGEEVTRLELVTLHKAIQRHCTCRCSGPAILDEACPAHRMLRDADAIQRWVLIRRKVDVYLSAEFMFQRGR